MLPTSPGTSALTCASASTVSPGRGCLAALGLKSVSREHGGAGEGVTFALRA